MNENALTIVDTKNLTSDEWLTLNKTFVGNMTDFVDSETLKVLVTNENIEASGDLASISVSYKQT